MAINRLAFLTREYNGYKGFRTKVLDIFSQLQDIYGVRTLSRTGLRFINVVPYTRENGLIPVDRFFHLSLQMPSALEYKPVNLSLIVTTELDGGQLTTKLEAVEDEAKTREALVLDFDYAKVRDLDLANVDEYLEESHAQTKRFFEGAHHTRLPGVDAWSGGNVTDGPVTETFDLREERIQEQPPGWHRLGQRVVDTGDQAPTKEYVREGLRRSRLVPVWAVSVEGRKRVLRRPLAIRIYQDDGFSFAANDELVITGTGLSPQKAVADFEQHLIHFSEEYKALRPDQLTGDAVRLKALFEQLFEEW